MRSLTIYSVLTLSVLLSGCDQVLPESKAALRPDYSPFEVHAPARSVRITEDGRYRVDSVVVYDGKNKARLIAELEKEKLSEKKSVKEIPAFLREFLDNLS